MKKITYSLCVLGCVVLFMFGPGTASAQYPVFIPHDSTNLGISTKIGMMGQAWGDYNNDGFLDLFYPGNGTPGALFRNDGGQGFTKVSKDSTNQPGVLFDSIGTNAKNSAVFADFDNDGKLDLVFSGGGIRLMKNNGYYFDQITTTAFGTAGYASGQNIWGITTGDFDKDGYLDIAFAGGNKLASALAGPVYILHNNRDMTFTDVASSFINGVLGPLEAWNPAFVDVNNDGNLDLFIPTIRSAPEYCELLLNDGGGFNPTDTGSVGGTGLNIKSAISSTWGDYNNDGYLDLLRVPLVADNDGLALKLFRNNGNSTFTDATAEAQLDTVTDALSRGMVFADIDNDGYLDIVYSTLYYGQRIMHNNGDGTFTDISQQCAVDTIKGREGRSISAIDYNNDGFLDLFIGSRATWKWLLTNSGNSNHWIAFRPRGVTDNSAGIGARFTLVAGGKRQTRIIEGGAVAGCASGNPWANFGLGSTTTVDSVIVDWPTGARDVSTNLTIVDNYYSFTQGTGAVVGIKDQQSSIPARFELKANYPNPFNPSTTITYALPEQSKVRVEVFDMLGRKIETLVDETKQAGEYSVQFTATDFASGVYVYKMTTPTITVARKMMLVK
jgi:enediyne biosynthesis protein E4